MFANPREEHFSDCLKDNVELLSEHLVERSVL